VFGDTQNLVDGGVGAEEKFARALRDGWDDSDPKPRRPDENDYQNFARMVDWVIAEREAQGIDFVLHVGDIVEHGRFPPIHESCKDGRGGCLRPNRGVRCGRHTPPCPKGCGPNFNNTKCRICDPRGSTKPDRRDWSDPGGMCAHVAWATWEWSLFNAQWKRLRDAGIPYAIVRGNHDNIGGGDPSDPYTYAGYVDYYGPGGSPGASQGWVATCSPEQGQCRHPDAQAWKFMLGDQEVLVIGPSHGPDKQQRDWIEETLRAHSPLPTILLAHTLTDPRCKNCIQLRDTIALAGPLHPQIFWTAEGHFAGAGAPPQGVVRSNGTRTLRTRSDWQGATAPYGSFLHLVRFYLREGRIAEVEVEAFSPVTGETSRAPSDALPRQPLRSPQP